MREPDKLMTAREAVKKFVRDGCSLTLANFATSEPFALVHEVIRQGKRDLYLIKSSGFMASDQLLAAGCVRRILTSWHLRMSPTSYYSPIDKLLKEKKVEIEDYTNWTVAARLLAGAWGLPFFPVRGNSLLVSDIARIRSFEGENKLRVVENPFRPGEKVVLVSPLNPDVALIHAQRADVNGNVQLWGPLGDTVYAALASKVIIASVEEIVEEENIRRSPFLTLIPEFRVNAIVHEEWGAHPMECLGYYDMDEPFLLIWYALLTRKMMESFMDEWIFGVENRKEYIEHYIERFGMEKLNSLRAKKYLSDTVNLGSTFEGDMKRWGIDWSFFDQSISEMVEWEVEG